MVVELLRNALGQLEECLMLNKAANSSNSRCRIIFSLSYLGTIGVKPTELKLLRT
jgi:hypothetical protein